MSIPSYGLPVQHCDYPNLRLHALIPAPPGCIAVIEDAQGVHHEQVAALALVTADGDSWIEPMGVNGLVYGHRAPGAIAYKLEWTS